MSNDERKSNDRYRNVGLWLAVFISLMLHALLAYFSPLLFRRAPQERDLQSARVVFRPKRLENTNDDALKPVVSLPPNKTLRPPSAKFYAEQDQQSDKEQRAANRSFTAKNLSSHPETQGPASARAREHLSEEQDSPPAHQTPGTKRLRPRSRKVAQRSADDPFGLKIRPGKSSRDAMPFFDHIPDVEEGDATKLNAWQWQHAEFFNRIKASVAHIWAPNEQIARYDPQGTLLGQFDRTTLMLISIDRQGQLTKLTVAKSSGVFYLDEEAERAFRLAAPFPFPPPALFKNLNEFTFKFAFHLQLNRGVSLNFDWSSN